LLAAACGSDSGSPGTGSPPKPPVSASLTPTGKAYDALTAGDQAAIRQVIADVDQAVSKDPDDGRANFYSAVMRFWQLGEEIDLPASPADLVAETRLMIDRFRTAQEKLPNDDRAPAFGGLAKVVIGDLFKDSAMHAEGMSDIDEGIRIFPSYSHFLRALASAEAPADSENFAAVIPELEAVLDTCGVERDTNGNIEYLEGPLPSDLRVCNDDGIVPHVWEGFLLNYGDLVLKGGKSADEARVIYRSAKAAPRFDKWPFASALQERIDHADERAALYADFDASNDPKIWMQDGHICTGCHQDNR
jgi:hypothetical protein